MKQTNLRVADISYAIVALPAQPLFNSLIEINRAITKNFPENRYELSERFPPHLTLFQGGISQSSLSNISQQLSQLVAVKSTFLSEIERIRPHPGGFIDLLCKGKELTDLVGRITGLCAEFHSNSPVYRPRLLERFNELPSAQKEETTRTGSDKSGVFFDSHLSLATVKAENLLAAAGIAEDMLSLPCPFELERIILIDCGHQNEHWEVIKTLN